MPDALVTASISGKSSKGDLRRTITPGRLSPSGVLTIPLIAQFWLAWENANPAIIRPAMKKITTLLPILYLLSFLKYSLVNNPGNINFILLTSNNSADFVPDVTLLPLV
jgi:hypothetical protein